MIAAPTLAASVGPSKSVSLLVTPPSGAVSLKLARLSPSGETAYVRGANPRTLVTTDPVTVVDYEAPIGVPLTYAATVMDSGGVESAAATAVITIASAGCDDTWLVDLARPANTLQIMFESFAELDYGIDAGVHWILARRDPIVTSGLAHTATFEAAFLTETLAERDTARDALGNGTPLLFRTPPENGIGNLYFSCLGWREQRIVTRAVQPDRRFLVSGVEVFRPDPALFVTSPTPPVPFPPPDV